MSVWWFLGIGLSPWLAEAVCHTLRQFKDGKGYSHRRL